MENLFNIKGDAITGTPDTMKRDMSTAEKDQRNRWETQRGKPSSDSLYREQNKERLNKEAREKYHKNKQLKTTQP